MNAPCWLRRIFTRNRAPARRPRTTRLHAELLEDRSVPSIVLRAAFYDQINGSYPEGTLALDPSGDLFGITTQGGQFTDGTIFEVPAQTGDIVTLASFDGADGANPTLGPTLDASGNLYGLTNAGVYELARGSGTITMVPAPSGTNSVLVDSGGNLFGTTGAGGALNQGSVFEIKASSSGVVTTLATFNGANGAMPNFGSLFLDSSGNLFGTTAQGGTANAGTVFELTKGSSTITTLASVASNNPAPFSNVVVDGSGNVFGTMPGGGTFPTVSDTIFEVKHGSGAITGIASVGVPDEGATGAPLAIDQSGDVFGTLSGSFGDVFEIPQGSSKVTYLPFFGGTTAAGVTVDSSGNLFGTTTTGSSNNHGTVYELAKGYISVTTLASFGSLGGSYPSGLVQDSSGNLFGVTFSGGEFGDGTVFELLKGSSTITVLAPFAIPSPDGGLLIDSNGNLFGTTERGGTNDYGIVFEVQKGSGTISALASFTSDQFGANGGLLEDSSGNLFGTTGNGNGGTFFEVAKGSGMVTTLATFNTSTGVGPGPLIEDQSGNYYGLTFSNTIFEIQKGSSTIITRAAIPAASLVVDSNGNLFGSTAGTDTPLDGGTIFELPAGSSTPMTLAVFSIDQADPYGLALDSSGNLFGMTVPVGTVMGTYDGTVFELKKGTGTVITLGTFSGAWGNPEGPLLVDSNGNVFGADGEGGPFNDGDIFEVPASPPPVFSTASLKNWTVNQPGYSQQITVTGGAAPYSFSTMGPLPVGLTLGSGGVITGTPSVAGTYTFTITVVDSLNTASNQTYTIVINPPPALITPALDTATVGTSYSQMFSAAGGTGSYTFAASSAIPAGLTLSSGGVLSGTPTATGNYSFEVTVTDAAGASNNQWFTLTVAPVPFSQFLVSVSGPSTVEAGTTFLVSVQEADASGKPVTGYNGPVVVTAFASQGGGAGTFLATVTLNSSGIGVFIASFQQVGAYTITVGSLPILGAMTVTVTPGPAVRLAFASQPWSTATGVPLFPVTVQVQDLYGNVVSGDNSDAVVLGIGSGPGPFTNGSTVTATVQQGVATFNNLTLIVPGSYTLSAIVPGKYTGPSSLPFTISPLQVVRDSFLGSPSGFSVQLNGPILVSATTPVLYGTGTTVTPTVTLTQETGTPPAGSTLPYQVPGSLIFDAVTNTLTFLETDTESLVNNGIPVLPDGAYVAHISGSGVNGLQAANSGGGYLDGTSAGTPGHDFTATFGVNAAYAEDVVWVPSTADGPGQLLSAPGKNQAGGEYPIYIDDLPGQTSYSVTDVTATLTYNPSLLTVTPSSTATFTVTVPSAGTALLHYRGSALAAGNQTPIGFITAAVPAGTTASPIPYKAEDVLHLSGVSLNGGSLPVTTSDGLHVVAYVGDADGNGAYSSSDAVLITRVTLQTNTGFAAYPVVDPVIVADTDGSGFIPSDAALQVNEAGVGVPTQNLPVPPIPGGVHFQALVQHVSPSARTASAVQVEATTSVPDFTALVDYFAQAGADTEGMFWPPATVPGPRKGAHAR